MTKHTRNIIKKEGGNLIDAYRLPDDLFSDAKVTVDVVFFKKGYTAVKWLYTRKVKVNNYLMPINEFYVQHPEKILGTLDVVDMYERKGLTCKRNADNIFKLLHSKLSNTAQEESLIERCLRFSLELRAMRRDFKCQTTTS